MLNARGAAFLASLQGLEALPLSLPPRTLSLTLTPTLTLTLTLALTLTLTLQGGRFGQVSVEREGQHPRRATTRRPTAGAPVRGAAPMLTQGNPDPSSDPDLDHGS